MREALAASVLATVAVVMVGAGIMGPVRGQDVIIYPQAKLPAAQASDRPAAPAHFHWDFPAGWRVSDEPVPMSFATISVPLPDGGSTTCSFSLVAAGPGMLAGNLTRWRGQLGLPADAPLASEEVASSLGPVTAVRMVNPDRPERAFLIGVLTFSDRILTVKLVAPAAALAALDAPFRALLASLRGDDGTH